jgi:septum formation protein
VSAGTSSSLILASASPRRRELLARLGIPFEVVPAGVDESVPEVPEDPVQLARDLAHAKAAEIAATRPGYLVLAADTIVVLDGRILGKPGSEAEAWQTLGALRGRPHYVITGVAVARGADIRVDYVLSTIHMRDYGDDEITDYIASGDPFDKAGSYAIQHERFRPVERYEGCYCNVVGLPLILTWQLLLQAGVPVPDLASLDLPDQCRHCPLGR